MIMEVFNVFKYILYCVRKVCINSNILGASLWFWLLTIWALAFVFGLIKFLFHNN